MLDKLCSKSDQQGLVKMIEALFDDSHTMVLLFSSPQVILNKSFLWLGLIDWLIAHGRLSMACVDKVHLFVHFGMMFRDKFKELNPVLFSKLKVRGSNTRSTTPILFMTASCTKSIVGTGEKMLVSCLTKTRMSSGLNPMRCSIINSSAPCIQEKDSRSIETFKQ
jgi:superfamily II DNA helicase RecQ